MPPKKIGPPRESPLRVGEPPYGVANGFWSYHQAEYRYHEARDPRAVIGPLEGRGWRPYPLRSEGATFWFDPTIPAQHGDIVLIQFEYPNQSPPNELSFMAKMLVEFADEYWLAFNTGMFPLGDTKILGVEVRNPHRPNRAFSALTPNVLPSAATDVAPTIPKASS